MTPQPVILSDGSVLMFNGEIFDCSGDISSQPLQDASDTQILTNLFENHRQLFPQIFSSIKGPYAFVFFDKSTNRLWYGRDIVGRRSLCLYIAPDENQLIICSVAPLLTGWREITTEGLHCIDLCGVKFHHSTWNWSHSLSGQKLDFFPSQSIPTPLQMEFKDVENMDEAVEGLRNLLSSSIRKRVCLRREGARVAILFSGGLDSTVIALMASEILPRHEQVDLLNVAFKSDAPDRFTAIKAHEILSKLHPNRTFNLVLIDPSKEELESFRSEQIRFLIFPCQTVLDDSVGCALWFASRGAGVLHACDDRPYKSTATILLHGLGADELMAGYSRHRRVYYQSARSPQALQKELNMDIERLHTRNLGRDDRIVSDHGKEVRFPFLDEDVISYLNALSPEYKCNLEEPRGVGEKKLLRKLAASLDLGEVASTEKRALQFGSRIAKLEQRKEKGSMNCSRLEL